MKNNLQYLTKWCHAMGYSIRIGLNNLTIRHKTKTMYANIENINNMNRESFVEYRELITWYMEDKINEKR